MKAKVTFFFILHVNASKTFSKIGKVLLQQVSINFVFMTECPILMYFGEKYHINWIKYQIFLEKT